VIAASLPLLLSLATGAAPATAAVDVDLVVCQAAREQQAIEVRWRQYEYPKDDLLQKIENDQVVASSLITRFIHRTRPDGLAINEVTAIDGKPLSPEQVSEEKAKLRDRRAELDDPREHARSLIKARKDSNDKASTMAAMTEAFQLRLEGIDWVGEDPCFVVSFRPRSTYRPSTKEQETFQKMQGVAWVRVRRPAFLRIEADFIENASVRFGPFATITKGSHFLLQQGEIEPGGVVMTRSLDLGLKLRLFLVVHREERRVTTYRELKRVNPKAALPEP
jgi:hypothetical protein